MQQYVGYRGTADSGRLRDYGFTAWFKGGSMAAARARLSKRLLLVPALLADEFDAGRALLRRNPVGRAAFAALGLDAGIALLHHDGLARHGFANQTLGLFSHLVLRHSPLPVTETSLVPTYSTRIGFCDHVRSSRLNDDVAVLDVNRKGFGHIGTLGQGFAVLDH